MFSLSKIKDETVLQEFKEVLKTTLWAIFLFLIINAGFIFLGLTFEKLLFFLIIGTVLSIISVFIVSYLRIKR